MPPANLAFSAQEEDGGKSGKLLRREREMRRRAARSSLVQTLAAELEGAPLEVKHSVAEGESAFVRREADRLARRAAEEEDLFARVPMRKEEKKRAAAAAKKKIGMSSQVADFGDDLADLMEAAREIDEERRTRLKPSAVAAAATVSLLNAKRSKREARGDRACFPLCVKPAHRIRSEHLSPPPRPSFPPPARVRRSPGTRTFRSGWTSGSAARRTTGRGRSGARRRRSGTTRRARAGAAPRSLAGLAPACMREISCRRERPEPPHPPAHPLAHPQGPIGHGVKDDEAYVAAAEAARERKAARRREHGPERFAAEPIVAQALGEVGEDEKREIGAKIASNRGLTPHRNKDYKNPRKKHRIRFDKAVVRRKSSVREVQPGAAGGYGGEMSGIKASISRSRRF